MEYLFKDADGKAYSAEDIFKSLKMIGADDCETLFIHSDVMFGAPAVGFNRRQYLNILYDVIKDLGVKNIIVPTFTYSFCNGETYNVAKSKTTMGAFNEFIRNQEGRYRTRDPLLSISVPMELKDYFIQYDGQNSLGEKSGSDAIHHMEGVKFLFLGAEMKNCFTYVHYVEKMLDVPYRFDMEFQGNIIEEDGRVFQRCQSIHTACYGVKPAEYYYFEDYLEEIGLLKKVALGDKAVSCIFEQDAYREIKGRIEKDINYFLEVPFTQKDLVHKYTMGQNGERITHC